MAVVFSGGTGATPVPPNSRLRVTWRWTLSDYVNPLGILGFDAPGIAEKIREALPSQGYIPASLPSAAPGDEVIVYNVKVSGQQPTRTLADHAALLNATPVSSLLGGRIVEVIAVDLTAIADNHDGTYTLRSPSGGAAPTSRSWRHATMIR